MADPALPAGPLSGRRVLIVTLGTRGDVQPFIALCDALKRQGAAPLLATVPHYVSLGGEFNVPVTSILEDGVIWPDMNALGGEGVESKDEFEMKLILEPYARLTRCMLRRIESLAEEHQPDVVIVGMIVWFVQWLRETLRRPLVHVHLQPTRWLATERASDRNARTVRLAEVLAQQPLLDADFIRGAPQRIINCIPLTRRSLRMSPAPHRQHHSHLVPLVHSCFSLARARAHLLPSASRSAHRRAFGAAPARVPAVARRDAPARTRRHLDGLLAARRHGSRRAAVADGTGGLPERLRGWR